MPGPSHLPRANDLDRAITDHPTFRGGLQATFQTVWNWTKLDTYILPRAANQHSVIRLASSCKAKDLVACLELETCQFLDIFNSSHSSRTYLVCDSDDKL